jgi:hypothetical protein
MKICILVYTLIRFGNEEFCKAADLQKVAEKLSSY